MHFKRNLWLSITGVVIIIIALLFGPHQNEPSSGASDSLPQFSQFKPQQDSMHTKGSDAHSSYIKH